MTHTMSLVTLFFVSLPTVAHQAEPMQSVAVSNVEQHAVDMPKTTSLMPLPTHVDLRAGSLCLGHVLVVKLTPPADDTQGSTDVRIKAGINQLHAHMMLSQKSLNTVQSSPSKDAPSATMDVAWDLPGAAVQTVEEDESYVLDITKAGITLHAQNPLGVLHGLQTLSQWIELRDGVWVAPLVRIRDEPRFVWRGILIDVARHFMPVPLIKRQLDAMAAVKMNVFHWHLTDDQGFRVEIKRFAKLHGCGSAGEYYTQQQVREVVDYARLRGIRVVPEIDMPGHVDSWLLGYPELSSGPPPKKLTSRWGILDASLDPTREQTYTFVDGVLAELAELFPDAYVHIGGDEVNGKQWRAAPHIVAFMQARGFSDTEALQAYFVGRVAKLAAKHGKHVVGWDEISQPGLQPQTVIQSWRGQQGLVDAVSHGYKSILSHGYYLGSSAADHYLNDPAEPFGDSLPVGLLGGEVCQWTELVPPNLLESSLWPRAAAVAERLWSAPHHTDLDDLYRRLNVQSHRFSTLGVDPAISQRQYLAQLVRGRDVGPLAALAAVIEPRRGNWWPGFRDKRLFVNFADFAYPDSMVGRQMRDWAATAVDPTASNEMHQHSLALLVAKLHSIIANHEAVTALVADLGGLADVVELNDQVAKMAQLGLEAAYYLEDRSPPPASWRAGAKAMLIDRVNIKWGAVVAFSSAVGTLVHAVASEVDVEPKRPPGPG